MRSVSKLSVCLILVFSGLKNICFIFILIAYIACIICFRGASPCNPHQPMSIMGNNTGSLPDLTSLHYPIPTLQYAENVPTMQYNTVREKLCHFVFTNWSGTIIFHCNSIHNYNDRFHLQLSDYRTGRPSPSTSPTFYSSLSNNEEFMAPESPSSQPPFNIG